MTLHRNMAVLILCALFLGTGYTTGVAHAVPAACDHREPGHIGRHGGQLEDNRFHLARGERVTCSDEKPDEHRREERHDAGEHHDDGEQHQDSDHLPHLGRDKHRWWRND